MSTHFKIATWNVNSLRVRLPQVLRWLSDVKPDVLALQETKLMDSDFPIADIHSAGYECVFSGQKTYNGMAILSRQPCTDMIVDIPELQDHQRRVLGVTIESVRILNLYVPNGESIHSEKYIYKLHWLKHLMQYLAHDLKQYPQFVMVGDFNIAPDEIDVYDPKAWKNSVLFSDKERDAFHEMTHLGLFDVFRELNATEKTYTWWDYRLNAFKRNMGLRIDHILASQKLMRLCKKCYVDRVPRTWERPSDHAPVVAEFIL